MTYIIPDHITDKQLQNRYTKARERIGQLLIYLEGRRMSCIERQAIYAEIDVQEYKKKVCKQAAIDRGIRLH